jgi:hypothetical protein
VSRILKSLIFAVPLLVALAPQASAQTPATTGGAAGTSLASPYGALALPTTTAATPAGGSATGTTSGTSATGSTSGGGGGSNAAGTGGSTTSGRTASAGSSGTATTARPSSVPSWLLCPPTGAGGLVPFVTGTDLSCAP